jgi:hypothetical protein
MSNQSYIKNRIYIAFVLVALLFGNPNEAFAQLINSNFGLRQKMGISLSQQMSSATYDDFDLQQHQTNFQVYLPLLVKVDTSTSTPKIALLKAEYTFRNTENVFSNNVVEPFPTDFYANSLALNFTHTIGYPFFLNYSLRFTYSGDYGDYNPLHITASTYFIYRINKKLRIGAGIVFQQSHSDFPRFLYIPYVDWRLNENWFIDITSPVRFLFGRNFGKRKITQLALGSYLEFITRYAFHAQNTDQVYESTDIAVGLDFRTQLYKKLFFNAFVGNNVYKHINFISEESDYIIKSNLGLNFKVGLSLNLE